MIVNGKKLQLNKNVYKYDKLFISKSFIYYFSFHLNFEYACVTVQESFEGNHILSRVRSFIFYLIIFQSQYFGYYKTHVWIACSYSNHTTVTYCRVLMLAINCLHVRYESKTGKVLRWIFLRDPSFHLCFFWRKNWTVKLMNRTLIRS